LEALGSPWKPLRSLSAAAVLTLFSGPVLAETVQLMPDADNFDDRYFLPDDGYDDRYFFTETHLSGEGWHYDGDTWVAGEIDVGFKGSLESRGNPGEYHNRLNLNPYLGDNDWLYPSLSPYGVKGGELYGGGGSYQYSDNAVTGWSATSRYRVGEDGSLLLAERTVVNQETGAAESYGYVNWDWYGPSPIYSYEYADGEGGYSTSDAPFDTDALLTRIKGDFPTSRYGIFDFENSWIDYEGDGLGPISLAQLFEPGGYYDRTSITFQGGNYDVSAQWNSAFPIASVTIAINPVPEPETWGMLLSGLGLMGLIARRRRKHG
jgi:hypothetical protein